MRKQRRVGLVAIGSRYLLLATCPTAQVEEKFCGVVFQHWSGLTILARSEVKGRGKRRIGSSKHIVQ